MKTYREFIFEQKPKRYAVLYLILIPLYALIFYLLPVCYFHHGEGERGFFSLLYFSVVTITTLGFGDITPVKTASQMLTASESLIGITLIGLFLNALSHDRSARDSEHERSFSEAKLQKDQAQKLLRFDNVGRNYIDLYLSYVKIITTPQDRRTQGQEWDRLFSLKDMRDMYKPSLLLTDATYSPAILKYFKYQKQLEDFVKQLLFTVDLKYWPNLESLCSNYITFCQQLDFTDFILKQVEMKIGDRPAIDVNMEMLASYDGDYEFPAHANAITPYIALYKLIQIQLTFIEQYQAVLGVLRNDSQNSN